METEQRYTNDSISQALDIMRNWIGHSFRQRLLNRGWSSLLRDGTPAEIEVSVFVIFCN